MNTSPSKHHRCWRKIGQFIYQCMHITAWSPTALAIGFSLFSVVHAAPPKLLQQWRFQKSDFEDDILHGIERETAKTVQPQKFDKDDLLVFSERQHLVVSSNDLERKLSGSFTVEAWVRIDKQERRGCVVGYQQDNGDYERGWSLGYNHDRFEMRCSDGKQLVLATASDPMALGEWHHVVGICDVSQREIRLYVDGRQSAKSNFEATSVQYPDPKLNTQLVLGAYKDTNEFFPMEGRLREVRLYDGVANADLIAAHVQWQSSLPNQTLAFTVRPGVRFLTPTSAEVTWDTTIAGGSGVAYGTTKQLGKLAMSDSKGQSHQLVLSDLIPGKTYWYRFGSMTKGKRVFSPLFQFDGSMNYSPPEIDLTANAGRVQLISDLLDQLGGYAVVDAQVDASWAESISAATEMTVVVCADDEMKADEMRRNWHQLDAYGIRLSVQQRERIPRGIANLVVVDESSIGEALKWRSPVGCVLALNQRPTDQSLLWTKIADDVWLGKADSESSTAWGHQYGSLGNTVFSGETLNGIDDTADLEMRWIGRPGADFGIDRNPRMPAPLAIGGRLFHQGMNRMIALDAFNGAVLWSLEIPDLRRVNIPRDSANWCADASHVYAAVKNRLWVIDAASGKMQAAIPLPDSLNQNLDWGYVATTDDLILGTATKTESNYTEFWSGKFWYEKSDDSITAKVCGDAILAYDKDNRKLRWQYASDAIVQSTIAISATHVYFVEVNDPSLRTSKTGRLPNSKIWDSASIVCLDLQSGQKIWTQPCPAQPHEALISFGMCNESQYLLQTSGKGHFHFAAFDSSRGTPRWKRSLAWSESDHSASFQHAVWMNHQIYIQPHILDDVTGEILKSDTLGKRRGCATPVGLGNAILFRGGTGPMSLWSLKNDSRTELTRLRQSCWLSTIAAEGMLFSPEGGGGCSCGGWMETSIGFAPRTNKASK